MARRGRLALLLVGALMLAGPTSCRLSPGDPDGNLDANWTSVSSIGVVSIMGWALDDSDRTAAVVVHLVVDGSTTTAVTADSFRPDIDEAFPGAGPLHGIAATLTPPPGPHRVCAFAVNIGAGLHDSLLGCLSITVPDTSPIGAFEAAQPTDGVSTAYSGWALDPDTTAPISVVVSINGVDVATGIADKFRPDVGVFYPTFGADHGFIVVTPTPVRPAIVCVRARNIGAGADSVLATCQVQRAPAQ